MINPTSYFTSETTYQVDIVYTTGAPSVTLNPITEPHEDSFELTTNGSSLVKLVAHIYISVDNLTPSLKDILITKYEKIGRELSHCAEVMLKYKSYSHDKIISELQEILKNNKAKLPETEEIYTYYLLSVSQLYI